MDVVRICSELVRIRSENPPGNTAEVTEYIRDLLSGYGIRSTVTEREPGRCSLVTGPSGSGLLLCGHVDVVPALGEGWSVDPFSGTVKDGAVWGRGATDMKGGCAAILAACIQLAESGEDLPAQLALVCDEETGGECGIRHLIARRLVAPSDCLIAEPTPERCVNIGQKGLVRLSMEFSGSPGHGSLYPAVGRSAIEGALSFMEYVKTLHDRTFPHDAGLDAILARSSEILSEEFCMPCATEVLTRIMYNPGVIRGGEKANIVAQKCCLELEMRIPWGCSIPELLAGIRAHAPDGTIVSEISNLPSLTDPSCRITTATCRAVQEVYGGEVTPMVEWAASDARHLRAAGFRVVEYGPGELRLLHAIDERVRIESLTRAVQVYSALMRHYAGPDQAHS